MSRVLASAAPATSVSTPHLSRRNALLGLAALGASALSAGCRVEWGAPAAARVTDPAAQPSGTVVVYTSMYRHVLDALDPVLKRTLPGVEVKWFQGGSEKVGARLDADLRAGAAGADLLLTSDPFHYHRLKQDGHLAPFVSPHATATPRALVDLDNHWTCARVSVMVLAYHPDKLGAADAPTRFSDLWQKPALSPAAFGDPLSSGTFFATTATLARGENPTFLRALRESKAALGGGNSVVLSRILSGEAKAGAVLLENVLAAQNKGERVAWVMPADGAVMIPGPAALLKTSRNPHAAKAVLDVVLSPAGQRIIAEKGLMLAADPRVAPPKGAPGLSTIAASAQALPPAVMARIAQNKASFAAAVQKALLD